MDRDPATLTSWGFEPVPGYANENLLSPAINSDPLSWPAVWPASLKFINRVGWALVWIFWKRCFLSKPRNIFCDG